MSLKKHLSNNFFLFVFFTAFVFYSCGEKKVKKEFVARVNDSYLTEDELKLSLNSNSENRQGIIRKWIDTELLYEQAKKNGIIKDEKYLYLIEKQKKELAKALWIQKYFDENEIKITQKEIENYYNNQKESFKLLNDAFLLNEISFTNENKAIKFRNLLIDSDWNKATKRLFNDASVIEIKTNYLSYRYNIFSGDLLKILDLLQQYEVSLVMNTELNKYTIIQLIQRYKVGDIPSLNFIKETVEQRLIEDKKKLLLQNFIDELYSKNEIEIKK